MNTKMLLKGLALLSVLAVQSQSVLAAESEDKIVRYYLKGGETIDYNAEEIDSISVTEECCKIWNFGSFDEILLSDVDSMLYISPELKLSYDELSFGKVKVGHSKAMNVTITNTSDYSETYMPMAMGVFNLDESGREVTLEPGESRTIQISFGPNSAIFYSSELLISSSSIESGLLSLPLQGRGVESELEEEDVVLPPEECQFTIELGDDIDEDFLSGFKVVNAEGEFPVDIQHFGKSRRAPNGDIMNTLFVKGWKSSNGLQTTFWVDSFYKPYIFTFTLPREQPFLTVRQMAIALLMSEPLLMTSDVTEYKNTVALIESLDAFPRFVDAVREVYVRGIRNQQCPDYSQINANEVLVELANKVYDNRSLTLSGLSLVGVKSTPESFLYRIQNDYKRLVHIYPSQVKMDEDFLLVKEKKEETATIAEMLQNIATGADYVGSEYKALTQEELDFVKDIQEWCSDLEDLLAYVGLGDIDSHIQFPIILESEHSDYWKIVKGSVMGDESSIFKVITGDIETKLDEDFDKVFIDIYGLGATSKPWNQYSNTDKLRLIFAMMHGCYKDFIRPMIETAVGIKKAYDATGSDNYKYDFRYGKRKYPEIALVMKLMSDFRYFDDYEKLFKNIENGDLWAIAKQLTMFACDRILTCPSEDPNDDKRTYTNLIYNIYKKYSGNSATSVVFRNTFKAVANNLTYLKRSNFAGKVINAAEYGLDLAGAIDAYKNSKATETFIIDKYTSPYIKMINPEGLITTKNSNVHFEWSIFKSKNYGKFLYDVNIILDTPNGVYREKVIENLDGLSCDVNLNNVPRTNLAVKIFYQVIAHHPENPDMIYAITDPILLFDMVPKDNFEFIDLDLPSHTLWATCNLGAKSYKDIGDYYAWGETAAKTSYSWKNYQYCKGTPNTLTKYCTNSSYGWNNFTDDNTELEGIDDAISSLYGNEICMPTQEDWEELMAYARWSKLDDGILVKGYNGNVIFLPLAGYRNGINVYDLNKEGSYWSSTLDAKSPDDACFLYIGNAKPKSYEYYRSIGRSIRPVKRVGQQNGAKPRQATGAGKQTPVSIDLGDGMVVKSVSRSAESR